MASVSVYNTTRFTALASGDVIGMVDISDTSQSAHGSFDSITVANFFATIPAPVNVTSASATALAVGLTGATNPAFTVDASTALQVAGLKVTGAVTGGTVAIVVTDSGSNANLIVNAKGSGTIGIGSVSTGRVTITPATTITGALTQTGLATFNAGATVASGQTLTVTGATITGLTAASVATGTFPGVYTITGALTLSAALTYGGVTLSNAVTGTGNMVLSAAPTLTGNATTGTINSQTISSTANFTGSVTIASTLVLNGNALAFQNGTGITKPADGVLTLLNDAGTGFTRLQFGGTTASFPALKRSTTTLAVRLADDSADAGITAATLTASGLITGNAGVSATTGTFSSTISATYITTANGDVGTATYAIGGRINTATTIDGTHYLPIVIGGAIYKIALCS